MLPFISFEWVTDMGHFVFHGGLWFALTVIGLGMMFCIIKSVVDVSRGGHGSHGEGGGLH